MVTDWTNDSFVGTIQSVVSDGLGNAGVADWLVSLVSDGIIGGLGAVLGLFRRWRFCSCSFPSLKTAVIWFVSHSSWTVYSVILDFRKELYPASYLLRLWNPWNHGFQNDRGR